jgi:hypothetical protein
MAASSIIKGAHEGSETTYVLRQLSRAFSDVIMPSIRDPPGFSLVMTWNCLVHRNAVRNVHFFVQSTMDYHHRAFYLSNSVYIRIYIQTCEGSEKVKDKMDAPYHFSFS